MRYESKLGEHASNLGGLSANEIAQSLDGARAFIADPVVVDELDKRLITTDNQKYSIIYSKIIFAVLGTDQPSFEDIRSDYL